MPDRPEEAAATATSDTLCVFCKRRAVDPAWRPFCSERCKLQDLARWADGTYRIAGDSLPDPQESNDTHSR